MIYELIVIGAGVEGSATAYHSAKQGAKTLLLEQFALPHSRGSSHGQSRIIRKAYDKHYYASMMGEAYNLWFELEKESSTKLYVNTGLLNVGKTNEQFLNNAQKSLDRIGSPYHTLNSEQLKKKFPQFSFGNKYQGLFDPTAGVLFADKALEALHSQFKTYGGTLRDAEKVTDIVPGDIITVTTNRGVYKSSRVVIAAGPWTNKILHRMGMNLPLEPQRIEVLYWKEHKAIHSLDQGFPTFIFDDSSYHLYGLPAYEYPGLVKVCSHVGPAIDPDSRDKTQESAKEHVANFIKKNMPEVETEPSIKETCIYTVTADSDFILDQLPHHRNIFVAAGFSGHGFKLAPVVGKLMYEMAANKKPSYDLSPFTIDRFKKKAAAKL